MAAAGTVSEIDLGPGRLYYAPIATAVPTTASAVLPSAWAPVGYTDDGTTIDMSTTTEGITPEEELEPVLYYMTGRTTKLKYSAMQSAIENLALAAGAGVITPGASFKFPAPDALVAVRFVWDSHDPDHAEFATLNRRWAFHKCYPSGTVSLTKKKAPNVSLIPSEFDCAYDGTEETPVTIFPNAAGLI